MDYVIKILRNERVGLENQRKMFSLALTKLSLDSRNKIDDRIDQIDRALAKISGREQANEFLPDVKIMLPCDKEIDSMTLEMDCPTPNEEYYTTNGFKSGVKWLKNTIERQMIGNKS